MSSQKKAVLQIVVFSAMAWLLGAVVSQDSSGTAQLEQRASVDLSRLTGAAPEQSQQRAAYKLVHSNGAKSFPGFTIVPVSGTAETLLVNHAGQVVHRWSQDSERARLLENCNLVVLHGSKWGYRQPEWRDKKFSVREYSWNDAPVWQFDIDEWAHHDILQRENGNYIFLKRTTVSAPGTLQLDDAEVQSLGIRSDTILEVNREKEIVWRWNVHDTFDFDYCGWRGCDHLRVRNIDDQSTKLKAARSRDLEIDQITDWSHTNTVTEIPDNQWYRAGDSRFRPGNLMIIIRNFWTAYIIDKQTGKIVWDYNGNPVEGDPASGVVRGHDIYMIPEGMPGAGNVLLFDNGLKELRAYSRILEVNPVTEEIVWEYSDPNTFFSDAAGSVQRLPNGNTLISEDKSGRIFEVTAAGEVVWDLRGPHRISRAQRYEYNYCPEFKKLPLR